MSTNPYKANKQRLHSTLREFRAFVHREDAFAALPPLLHTLHFGDCQCAFCKGAAAHEQLAAIAATSKNFERVGGKKNKGGRRNAAAAAAGPTTGSSRVVTSVADAAAEELARRRAAVRVSPCLLQMGPLPADAGTIGVGGAEGRTNEEGVFSHVFAELVGPQAEGGGGEELVWSQYASIALPTPTLPTVVGGADSSHLSFPQPRHYGSAAATAICTTATSTAAAARVQGGVASATAAAADNFSFSARSAAVSPTPGLTPNAPLDGTHMPNPTKSAAATAAAEESVFITLPARLAPLSQGAVQQQLRLHRRLMGLFDALAVAIGEEDALRAWHAKTSAPLVGGGGGGTDDYDAGNNKTMATPRGGGGDARHSPSTPRGGGMHKSVSFVAPPAAAADDEGAASPPPALSRRPAPAADGAAEDSAAAEGEDGSPFPPHHTYVDSSIGNPSSFISNAPIRENRASSLRRTASSQVLSANEARAAADPYGAGKSGAQRPLELPGASPLPLGAAGHRYGSARVLITSEERGADDDGTYANDEEDGYGEEERHHHQQQQRHQQHLLLPITTARAKAKYEGVLQLLWDLVALGGGPSEDADAAMEQQGFGAAVPAMKRWWSTVQRSAVLEDPAARRRGDGNGDEFGPFSPMVVRSGGQRQQSDAEDSDDDAKFSPNDDDGKGESGKSKVVPPIATVLPPPMVCPSLLAASAAHPTVAALHLSYVNVKLGAANLLRVLLSEATGASEAVGDPTSSTFASPTRQQQQRGASPASHSQSFSYVDTTTRGIAALEAAISAQLDGIVGSLSAAVLKLIASVEEGVRSNVISSLAAASSDVGGASSLGSNAAPFGGDHNSSAAAMRRSNLLFVKAIAGGASSASLLGANRFGFGGGGDPRHEETLEEVGRGGKHRYYAADGSHYTNDDDDESSSSASLFSNSDADEEANAVVGGAKGTGRAENGGPTRAFVLRTHLSTCLNEVIDLQPPHQQQQHGFGFGEGSSSVAIGYQQLRWSIGGRGADEVEAEALEERVDGVAAAGAESSSAAATPPAGAATLQTVMAAALRNATTMLAASLSTPPPNHLLLTAYVEGIENGSETAGNSRQPNEEARGGGGLGSDRFPQCFGATVTSVSDVNCFSPGGGDGPLGASGSYGPPTPTHPADATYSPLRMRSRLHQHQNNNNQNNIGANDNNSPLLSSPAHSPRSFSATPNTTRAGGGGAAHLRRLFEVIAPAAASASRLLPSLEASAALFVTSLRSTLEEEDEEGEADLSIRRRFILGSIAADAHDVSAPILLASNGYLSEKEQGRGGRKGRRSQESSGRRSIPSDTVAPFLRAVASDAFVTLLSTIVGNAMREVRCGKGTADHYAYAASSVSAAVDIATNASVADLAASTAFTPPPLFATPALSVFLAVATSIFTAEQRRVLFATFSNSSSGGRFGFENDGDVGDAALRCLINFVPPSRASALQWQSYLWAPLIERVLVPMLETARMRRGATCSNSKNSTAEDEEATVVSSLVLSGDVALSTVVTSAGRRIRVAGLLTNIILLSRYTEWAIAAPSKSTSLNAATAFSSPRDQTTSSTRPSQHQQRPLLAADALSAALPAVTSRLFQGLMAHLYGANPSVRSLRRIVGEAVAANRSATGGGGGSGMMAGNVMPSSSAHSPAGAVAVGVGEAVADAIHALRALLQLETTKGMDVGGGSPLLAHPSAVSYARAARPFSRALELVAFQHTDALALLSAATAASATKAGSAAAMMKRSSAAATSASLSASDLAALRPVAEALDTATARLSLLLLAVEREAPAFLEQLRCALAALRGSELADKARSALHGLVAFESARRWSEGHLNNNTNNNNNSINNTTAATTTAANNTFSSGTYGDGDGDFTFAFMQGYSEAAKVEAVLEHFLGDDDDSGECDGDVDHSEAKADTDESSRMTSGATEDNDLLEYGPSKRQGGSTRHQATRHCRHRRRRGGRRRRRESFRIVGALSASSSSSHTTNGIAESPAAVNALLGAYSRMRQTLQASSFVATAAAAASSESSSPSPSAFPLPALVASLSRAMSVLFADLMFYQRFPEDVGSISNEGGGGGGGDAEISYSIVTDDFAVTGTRTDLNSAQVAAYERLLGAQRSGQDAAISDSLLSPRHRYENPLETELMQCRKLLDQRPRLHTAVLHSAQQQHSQLHKDQQSVGSAVTYSTVSIGWAPHADDMARIDLSMEGKGNTNSASLVIKAVPIADTMRAMLSADGSEFANVSGGAATGTNNSIVASIHAKGGGMAPSTYGASSSSSSATRSRTPTVGSASGDRMPKPSSYGRSMTPSAVLSTNSRLKQQQLQQQRSGGRGAPTPLHPHGAPSFSAQHPNPSPFANPQAAEGFLHDALKKGWVGPSAAKERMSQDNEAARLRMVRPAPSYGSQRDLAFLFGEGGAFFYPTSATTNAAAAMVPSSSSSAAVVGLGSLVNGQPSASAAAVVGDAAATDAALAMLDDSYTSRAVGGGAIWMPATVRPASATGVGGGGGAANGANGGEGRDWLLYQFGTEDFVSAAIEAPSSSSSPPNTSAAASFAQTVDRGASVHWQIGLPLPPTQSFICGTRGGRPMSSPKTTTARPLSNNDATARSGVGVAAAALASSSTKSLAELAAEVDSHHFDPNSTTNTTQNRACTAGGGREETFSSPHRHPSPSLASPPSRHDLRRDCYAPSAAKAAPVTTAAPTVASQRERPCFAVIDPLLSCEWTIVSVGTVVAVAPIAASASPCSSPSAAPSSVSSALSPPTASIVVMEEECATAKVRAARLYSFNAVAQQRKRKGAGNIDDVLNVTAATTTRLGALTGRAERGVVPSAAAAAAMSTFTVVSPLHRQRSSAALRAGSPTQQQQQHQQRASSPTGGGVGMGGTQAMGRHGSMRFVSEPTVMIGGDYNSDGGGGGGGGTALLPNPLRGYSPAPSHSSPAAPHGSSSSLAGGVGGRGGGLSRRASLAHLYSFRLGGSKPSTAPHVFHNPLQFKRTTFTNRSVGNSGGGGGGFGITSDPTFRIRQRAVAFAVGLVSTATALSGGDDWRSLGEAFVAMPLLKQQKYVPLMTANIAAGAHQHNNAGGPQYSQQARGSTNTVRVGAVLPSATLNSARNPNGTTAPPSRVIAALTTAPQSSSVQARWLEGRFGSQSEAMAAMMPLYSAHLRRSGRVAAAANHSAARSRMRSPHRRYSSNNSYSSYYYYNNGHHQSPSKASNHSSFAMHGGAVGPTAAIEPPSLLCSFLFAAVLGVGTPARPAIEPQPSTTAGGDLFLVDAGHPHHHSNSHGRRFAKPRPSSAASGATAAAAAGSAFSHVLPQQASTNAATAAVPAAPSDGSSVAALLRQLEMMRGRLATSDAETTALREKVAALQASEAALIADTTNSALSIATIQETLVRPLRADVAALTEENNSLKASLAAAHSAIAALRKDSAAMAALVATQSEMMTQLSAEAARSSPLNRSNTERSPSASSRHYANATYSRQNSSLNLSSAVGGGGGDRTPLLRSLRQPPHSGPSSAAVSPKRSGPTYAEDANAVDGGARAVLPMPNHTEGSPDPRRSGDDGERLAHRIGLGGQSVEVEPLAATGGASAPTPPPPTPAPAIVINHALSPSSFGDADPDMSPLLRKG